MSPEIAAAAITLSDLAWYGLVILLFLLTSAFFSSSETALTAVSRGRIYQLVKDGNKRAAKVSWLRKEKESLIGAVLLGNNVVNIAASAVATSLAIRLFGNNEQGLVLVTLVMTLLVVVFTEVLPKTYAIQNSERVSLALSPAVVAVVKILYPVTHAIQLFIRTVLRLFGVDITRANTLISATDALRGTIELHHREGQMVKQDRDMLGSILDLNDIEVRDIMVHRKNLDTIDAGLPAEQIVEQAVSMLHSRIPLWKDNPDNIVGILHVKDLVRTLNMGGGTVDNATILAIAHKPWFIPETTTLRDQLIAFRSRRQHFAVVVDEYGALLGIVTLEDIIEEIVGDIDDEHDEQEGGDIQRAAPNVYFVSGDVTIRDLNRELDWSLPDEHASTVAGLVMHEVRDIPARGRHFDLHGFRFTVVDRSPTQIRRLKVERLPPPRSEETAI